MTYPKYGFQCLQMSSADSNYPIVFVNRGIGVNVQIVILENHGS